MKVLWGALENRNKLIIIAFLAQKNVTTLVEKNNFGCGSLSLPYVVDNNIGCEKECILG